MKVEFEFTEALLKAIAGEVVTQIKPLLTRLLETQKREAAELMSVAELAVYLGGVSRDWIYQRTANNEIPFVKVGRLLKFRPADINAWLKEQSIPAVAPLSGPLPPDGRGTSNPVIQDKPPAISPRYKGV